MIWFSRGIDIDWRSKEAEFFIWFFCSSVFDMWRNPIISLIMVGRHIWPANPTVCHPCQSLLQYLGHLLQNSVTLYFLFLLIAFFLKIDMATVLRSTCNTFMKTLEECMQIANASFRPELLQPTPPDSPHVAIIKLNRVCLFIANNFVKLLWWFQHTVGPFSNEQMVYISVSLVLPGSDEVHVILHK